MGETKGALPSKPDCRSSSLSGVIDERREQPERNAVGLSRFGTRLQQTATRFDERWDPLRLDLLETTEQRARNLSELVRTPGLTNEELSLIAGPWNSLTDDLLEATVRTGRKVESLATTMADLIRARERVVQEHVSHTVQAKIQQYIEVAEQRLLSVRNRARWAREQLLQTRQRRARLADQRPETRPKRNIHFSSVSGIRPPTNFWKQP